MSSANLLVVNADGPETRVAVVEKGVLAELYIERKKERGIVGNIYKGKVVRVLPGMQCAFVDIGVEKAAFLYVGDVHGGGDFSFGDAAEEDDGHKKKGGKHERIEDLLKEGHEVLCQVVKEPIGQKGARITTFVSLAGRHLVFMPTVDNIGISRRIGTDKERKRLREIIDSQRPKGAGFIVRTVAEGAAEKELRDDMDFLIKLWREILRKNERARPASLLYSDLDLLLRTVRDHLTDEVDKLVIDSRVDYERVQKFVSAFLPEYQGRLELYDRADPIFDAFGIEAEIGRAIEKKVWLKSGGYLIIDQSEALTSIDVNTGRFTGKKNLEETITKNNLEACGEVADQLRLRNIGGIIVVDFIDMDKGENREKVFKAFQEAMKRDRSKCNITKISELGLVEMTRKRTRESLAQKVSEPCPYCEGKGHVKSRTTICYEILRAVRRSAQSIKDDTVVVQCHPDIAQLLGTVDSTWVEELEKRLQKRVLVKGRGAFHLEQFELGGKKALDKGQGVTRTMARPEAMHADGAAASDREVAWPMPAPKPEPALAGEEADEPDEQEAAEAAMAGATPAAATVATAAAVVPAAGATPATPAAATVATAAAVVPAATVPAAAAASTEGQAGQGKRRRGRRGGRGRKRAGEAEVGADAGKDSGDEDAEETGRP